MEENEKNFFHCYSRNLCLFLRSQGIRYKNKDINHKNNLTFYRFPKSKELDDAIIKWNELKTMEN